MKSKLIDLELFYGKEWFMEQFNAEYNPEPVEEPESVPEVEEEQIQEEVIEEPEKAPEEVEQVDTVQEDKEDKPTFDMEALNKVDTLSSENATLKQQIEAQKKAVEFYDYIKNNPHIIEAMREFDNPEVAQKFKEVPTQQESVISDMQNQLAELKLRNEVAELKTKYPDFDENKVLPYAGQRGIYDLESAYKAIKADEFVIAKANEKPVDMEAMRKQIREEILAELEEEKKATSSIVKGGITEEIQAKEYNLTPEQKYIAQQFGMTDEEYFNYMN